MRDFFSTLAIFSLQLSHSAFSTLILILQCCLMIGIVYFLNHSLKIKFAKNQPNKKTFTCWINFVNSYLEFKWETNFFYFLDHNYSMTKWFQVLSNEMRRRTENIEPGSIVMCESSSIHFSFSVTEWVGG